MASSGRPPRRDAIRPAEIGDVDRLNDIERRAQVRFRPYGFEAAFSNHLVAPSVLRSAQRAGRLFVAADPADEPIGFALVARLNDWAQLAEVDVVPEWGRRGVGTALVERAIDWARAHGFGAMVLSTMRDVPWNAPFYHRLGFEVIEPEALAPELRQLRAEEARRGLPVGERVIMKLDL